MSDSEDEQLSEFEYPEEQEPVSSQEVREQATPPAEEPRERMFTQAEVNALLADQKRKQRRRPKPKQEEPRASEPTGVTAEEVSFQLSIADLGVKGKRRDVAMTLWKENGMPDVDDFMDTYGDIVLPKPEPVAVADPDPDPAPPVKSATQSPDVGAPSPHRDATRITDPSRLTKEDIRRLGSGRVREIVEQHYRDRSNTMPRIFSRKKRG